MLRKKLKKLFSRFNISQLKRKDLVFIIPTIRFFVYFAITFLGLSVAFSYENKVLFFLILVLVSFFVVSTLVANEIIRGLKLHRIKSEPTEAGKEIAIEVELRNEGKFLISTIAVFPEFGFETVLKFDGGQKTGAIIRLFPMERGMYNSTWIKFQTEQPLGLFRAWKWLEIGEEIIIYPRPKNSITRKENFPKSLNSNARDESSIATKIQQELQDNWIDFREWNQYIAKTKINWKKSLRYDQILVTEYSKKTALILISWDQTKEISSFDDRLSQIVYWLRSIKNKEDVFVIQLPAYSGLIQRAETKNILKLLSGATSEVWS